MEKISRKTKLVKAYKPSDDIGGRYINQSNALVRAGHGLSLTEKRLVAMGVACLDSYVNGHPTPTSRIHAADYAGEFKLDINTAYDQLLSGSKHLYKRSITFFEAAYNRKGKPIEPTLVNMRWVGAVKYHKREGWVELHWIPQLMPHLTGLRSHFTGYRLAAASGLRSVYAWRLLELLARFRSTGVAEYTMEDFRMSLDIPASYKDFGVMRQKILDPAVSALKKSGWEVDCKLIKAGRRIKALRFTFKEDLQLELPGVEPVPL